jgi:hypothetical protein
VGAIIALLVSVTLYAANWSIDLASETNGLQASADRAIARLVRNPEPISYHDVRYDENMSLVCGRFSARIGSVFGDRHYTYDGALLKVLGIDADFGERWRRCDGAQPVAG